MGIKTLHTRHLASLAVLLLGVLTACGILLKLPAILEEPLLEEIHEMYSTPGGPITPFDEIHNVRVIETRHFDPRTDPEALPGVSDFWCVENWVTGIRGGKTEGELTEWFVIRKIGSQEYINIPRGIVSYPAEYDLACERAAPTATPELPLP